MEEKRYRKGIVAIIINSNNKFLLVQLRSYKDNEWNFVGGGRENDETPEQNLNRELNEELGLTEKDFKIIAKADVSLKYDFPKPVDKGNGIGYYGQIKDQFVVQFLGQEGDLQIQEEEIKKHKWVTVDELKDHLLFPNQLENALGMIKELIPGLVN